MMARVKLKGSGGLQQIGALASIGLVVGSIVGTGIFVTPSMVARFSTNIYVTFLLWAIGGLMCAVGGEIYGRLGQKYPVGGGPYIYLEKTLGKPIALVYGWMSFLVISPTMIASYSMFFGEQARNFIPHIALNEIRILALTFMAVITLINYFGIRATGNFEKIVVSLQVLLIVVLFVVLQFFRESAHNAHTALFPTSPISIAATAIVGILWSYEGFSCLSFVAHEVEGSAHRLTSYILIGCGVVVGVYFVLNYLALTFISEGELLNASNIAVPLAAKAFGSFGETMTFGMMIVAVFMTAVPSVLIGPRVTQQMATEGWLPKSLGKLHPNFTSPQNAILAQFVLSLVFIFAGDFEWLISCFISISWCFYILVAVGFLVMGRKLPGGISGIDWVKVLIFIGLALFVIAIQIYGDPKMSLWGLLLLGVSYISAKRLVSRVRI